MQKLINYVTGDKKKKALVAFVVLVLVQMFLVIALIVLGVKGKEEIGTDDGPGVPYYVGALVVGGVVGSFLQCKIVGTMCKSHG